MIVEQKPMTSATVAVGDGKSYMSRAEAETAMKAASMCVTAMRVDTAPRATEAHVLTMTPAGATTFKHFYNQNVYDAAGVKVGEIDDVLLGKDARVVAFVVGVGGFLGVGEKHVLVPFSTIQSTMKDNKHVLTIGATKDELKNAPGVKLDNAKTTWINA